MRVNVALALVTLAILLAVPQLALSAPVHNFDCKNCHLSGYSVDEIGGANVCLTCHGGVGPATKEFASGDASGHYGNNPAPAAETSHNWAATATNPAAGAAEPIRAAYPGFYSNYGTTTGLVACSRCHQPHADGTTNPKLLTTTAGGYAAFGAAPMSPNEMCLACHKAFGDSTQADHGFLSHPMLDSANVTALSGTAEYKDMTAFPEYDPADPYATGVRLVNGQITCLTCHGLHFTDSDDTTADGPGIASSGDGLMLVGKGMQFTTNIGGTDYPDQRTSELCNSCHNYEAHVHGSTDNVGCMACHGGHNADMGTPNVYMLKGAPGSYATIPANSTEKTDAWMGIAAGIDGFCETCHGDIELGAWDSVRDHTANLGAEDCTTCHTDHSAGSFSEPLGCDGCHGSPPSTNKAGNASAADYGDANGYAWAPNGSVEAGNYSYKFSNGLDAANAFYKDETTTPHTSHAGASSNYGYQCRVCHNTHIDNFAATHNKDNTSFQDVLEAASAFDSRTKLAGEPNPSYNDGAVTGTCSTVYCHSNGGVNDGTGARTYSYASPQWDDAGAGSKGSIVGTGGYCSACHGNAAGSMGSAKHDKHLNYGYDCNVCHTNTATSSADLVGALNSPPASHINQTLNIDFDSTNAIKAGGSAVAHGSTPYSDAAAMTCSAVYCHSSGQSVAASRSYKTISWTTAGPLTCTSCHDVPSASQTSAHTAHVSGSGSDVGRNLDCAVCHDDTMDTGSNVALGTGGLAFHVNGQVDINMSTALDSGNCSNISCHSDGNLGGTMTYNNPAWTSTPNLGCADCHGDGTNSYPTYASGAEGSEDANSHFKHADATQSNIACEECHSTTSKTGTSLDGSDKTQHVDQTIDVSFKQGGTWDGADTVKTCSSTACHVTGTPAWGGTVNCGDCHAVSNNATPLADSHGAHYEATTAGTFAETNTSVAGTYQINCGVCHSTNQGTTHAGGEATANYAAEVNFDGTIAEGTAVYNNGAIFTNDPNGFNFSNATCSNLYCHGNFGGNGNGAIPEWNSAASGDCGTCHDVDTTATMTGGSHQVHVNGALGLTCEYCHGTTAVNEAGGVADKATHVNQQLEVELDAAKNVFTVSSTYNAVNSGTIPKAAVGGPYDTCNNVYCHSDVQPDGGSGAPTAYATPTWGGGAVACGTCHPAPPSMASGSHTKHANAAEYAIGCGHCHSLVGDNTADHADYEVDVAISGAWGLSATYQYNALSATIAPGDEYTTCDNVYCHSDGKASLTYTQPKWGTTISDCVSCHDDASAGTSLSGAHEAHTVSATVTIGKNLGCADCHGSVVSDNTTIADKSLHAINKTVDVIDCSTNLCHSDGNTGNVIYNAPTFATDSYDCTTCHGNGVDQSYPSYTDGNSGTANSNSHNAHVGTSNITCEQCHDDTSTTGASIDGATPAQHVDGTIDVVFNPVSNPSGAYNDGTDTCSTTYCHGSGTPVWGGAALDCDACHSASNALENSHGAHYESIDVATGISTGNSSVIKGEYKFECGNCHNATTHAGGAVSANQAAEVSLFGSGSYTAGGSTAVTSPDRGFEYTAGTCNTNNCHNDGAGGVPNYNGATLQWSVTTLPADCTGCHDGNAAAASSMATGAHAAHMNDGTIMSDKSCQTCHDATLNASDTIIDDKTVHVNQVVNVAILGAYGGSFAAGDCSNVYCHSDGKATPTYNTVTWASETIGDCVSCHQGASAGTTLSGAHEAHVVNAATTIGKDLTCNVCHDVTVSDNTTIVPTTGAAQHVDGGVDVVSCATNDCHSDGNLDAAVITYNAPNFASDTYGCDDCHGDGVGNAYPTYADGGAGTGDSNSHNAHLNGGSNAIACVDCHTGTSTAGTSINGSTPAQHVDGTINVDIDTSQSPTGSYNAGGETCNNITCHGDGLGNVASPTPPWGGSMNCSSCHTSPLSTGSHAVHLADTGGSCGACHDGAVYADDPGGVLPVDHSDGNVDVYNTASGDLGYPQNVAMGIASWATCNAASCHDDGTGTLVTTPTWGDTSACAECHKNDMDTVSHAEHLNSAIFRNVTLSCDQCHGDTVKGVSAIGDGIGTHRDGSVDVYNSAAGDFGGGYITSVPADGTSNGTCNTTYCHGDTLKYSTEDMNDLVGNVDTTPTWGQSLISAGNGCDFCHGYPPVGDTGGGAQHPGNTDCSACHFHVNAADNGFIAAPAAHDITEHLDGIVQVDGGDSCTDCHGGGAYKDPDSGDHSVHTDADQVLVSKSLGGGDYGTGAWWYDVTYNASGVPLMGCGQCHPATEGTHLDSTVQVDVDPADESISAPNAKLGSAGATYTKATGTCSSVYCHSDGAGTYADIVGWNATAGDKGITCASCHGNSPSTNAHGVHEVGIHYEELYDDDGVGLMAKSTTDIGAADGAGGNYGLGAAHGNNSMSSTLNCYTCHSNTVADSANAGNATCASCHSDTDSIVTGNELARIANSSSVHLNGQPDVTFADLTTFKSKAQLRNDLSNADDGSNILSDLWRRMTTLTSYKAADGSSYDQYNSATTSYTPATKTCSTAACHNGVDVAWNKQGNIVPATYAPDCTACHTSLPQ